MGKDYLQKEPTKLEKKFTHQLSQVIGYANRINTGATALARHVGITPDQLAKLITEDKENEAYMNNLDLALREIARAEVDVEVSEDTKNTIADMPSIPEVEEEEVEDGDK